MDEATRNQVVSADPQASTWLTANAGSGKTRVLTDRVARLLLRGTRPERILCLTYTKAAATEMQNRLLRRLGEWAMLPEADLRRALSDLGEPDTADLTEARRLFALAIETPGGLKVQTIHSFCAALLRRFPLEAGVPLGFAELDDRSARVLRAEIVEEMAEERHPTIADLTALHGGHELDRFIAALPTGTTPDPAALWAAHGLAATDDAAGVLGQVFLGGEAELIAALIPPLAASGPNDQKAAARLQAGNWAAPGLADAAILDDVLLTGAGAKEPFTAKIGKFPTKGLQAGPCAPLMPALEDLMCRVEAMRPRRIALATAESSAALHRFAREFGARYDARKLAHGWLDFEDLISRAAALLSESSLAQWVLWRLDGGIDHILVDEAQDTSPDQWRVIARLTDEFTSGAGAVPRDRTLFVVGDPKQSIYSFQGADVAVFEAMRDRFDRAFADGLVPMARRELQHSFRSSPAILRLVDAVFQGDAAKGLGEHARHIAFHGTLPGRVDIWPPVAAPEPPEAPNWWEPGDVPVPPTAEALLANAVAAQIAALHGTPFHDIRQGRVRPLDYGDVLILVQGRKGKGLLFDQIIRACKAAGLPIAGADRLKLAAELAVRDIRAVLSVIDTPEDDLSLAAALRSPLFGLSEDALYRLAQGRRKREFLWDRLRNSGHDEAHQVLGDLMGQAGYLRPYDLISRLLIRHGGRARLLARLGQEAEDGIAELMSQALAYESVETPTLTGFLVWLSGDDVEVRRQAGSGEGGLIRVMTVHGAKGLESPLVILPDTARRKPAQDGHTIELPGGLVVWRGRKDHRPPTIEEAVAAQQERQAEERRRLLYVGMTRAESWLIVAAAGETGAGLDSWHAMISWGVDRAGLDRAPLDIPGVGTGLRLSFGDWPRSALADAPPACAPLALPEWARTRPPRLPRPPQPVAATALGGAKAIGGPGMAGSGMGDDLDRETAMLRGTRLHLLLEHLPGSDPADWPAIARAALAGAEGGLPDAAETQALLAEARAVIDAPDLAAIISPADGETVLAEVDLTANLPGLGTLHGTIDRLIVGPDRVLAVDYKSNAELPALPDAVPVGILRQMAAYRDALRLIYPGRRIETAVLWTTARRLMPLPDAVLDGASQTLDPPPARP